MSDVVHSFAQVVKSLVRDRLVLPKDESVVREDHPTLPEVVQGLEAIFECGLHDGSRWWDCWNYVLSELENNSEGLPDGLLASVGHNQEESRTWLLTSLQHPVSLEELFQRVKGNTSTLHAYYTSDSPMYDHDDRCYGALLKALSQLSSLEFDKLDLTPARYAHLFVKEEEDEEEEEEVKAVKAPTPAGTPEDVALVTEGKSAPKVPCASAGTQTLKTNDITQRNLEARLDLVQKQEMRLLRSQLEVQDRESALKRKEKQSLEASQYEEDLITIKELLVSLTDIVPEGEDRVVGYDGICPGAVPTPLLASRLDSLLQSLSGMTSSPSGSTKSGVNLAQTAPSLRQTTDSRDKKRAAPSQATSIQVLCGKGVDALDGIEEDFFAAGSDDDVTREAMGATPVVNDSFKEEKQWMQFDGYKLNEIGHVKRDIQMAEQGNLCAGCGAALPNSKYFRKPRLCAYTGEYFCSNCHKGETHVIPSLVINRWDFTPRKVCDAAHWHLRKMNARPILDIHTECPLLYKKVEALEKAHKHRVVIVDVMKVITEESGESVTQVFLPTEMKIYDHCLTLAETYSLQELCTIFHTESVYMQGMKGLLRYAASKAERIDAERVAEILRSSEISIEQ